MAEPWPDDEYPRYVAHRTAEGIEPLSIDEWRVKWPAFIACVHEVSAWCAGHDDIPDIDVPLDMQQRYNAAACAARMYPYGKDADHVTE